MSGNNGRLTSLDAFRGLTIAAMILVNSPGTYRAVYPQLRHAQWNGWTFADTIFPAFLFIMGVSIVFSLAAIREKGIPGSRFEFRVFKRTLILFGLGLFLNSYPVFHLSSLRIPGVLQRIAICYLFSCQIVLKTGTRGRIGWLVGLLASYWLMMRFVPAPGMETGILEPGCNFAVYVDWVFLQGHLWSHYQTWDPEGIVSTIPAISTTLFGVLTGDFLRSNLPANSKTFRISLTGLGLVVLGLLLDPWLPINKNIWTSTFSIFMAGISLLVLALFYWVMEVKEYRRWAKPFVIFGMNPIALYFLSEIMDATLRFIRLQQPDGSSVSVRSYLFRNFFAQYATLENASLLFALSLVFIMYLVACALWKKKLFIKV